MNYFIKKVKSSLKTRPSNAFILFLTGFLFAQVMILNMLYTRHPQGGWVTESGNIPTTIVLFGFLFALALCLTYLWRSVKPLTRYPHKLSAD